MPIVYIVQLVWFFRISMTVSYVEMIDGLMVHQSSRRGLFEIPSKSIPISRTAETVINGFWIPYQNTVIGDIHFIVALLITLLSWILRSCLRYCLRYYPLFIFSSLHELFALGSGLPHAWGINCTCGCKCVYLFTFIVVFISNLHW